MLFFLPNCRECGSDKMRFSQLRGIPEVLIQLIARPWRCQTCGYRQKKASFLKPRHPKGPGVRSEASSG
jgi:hypothetical protein